MHEPEVLTSTDLPVRSPDLVLRREPFGWLVVQLSAKLAQWLEISASDAVGQLLHEVFADVSPGLDYLATEVNTQKQELKGLPVHFLAPVDRLLRADVSLAAANVDDRRPLVHFFFRLAPAGQARVHPPQSRYGLVGQSPGIQEVWRKISLYAGAEAAVIVTGETGTGKELVARALHEQSARRRRPFVSVNCSAISDDLLESELFGHEKGAFTGAVRMHRGRFERADQGTIFLDEIGDMPLHAQVKLLRVLEDGCLERVGSERALAVNVRVIGATNVPLEQAVHLGRFRADLYHRLAVLRIHLPPLRQRPEDIPLLVHHFLESFRQTYQGAVQRLSPEAMTLLQAYLWPGNVRELRNVLERVYVESRSEVIGARAFKEWVLERQDFSPGEWGGDSVGRPALSLPYPLPSDQTLLPLRSYPLLSKASPPASQPRSTRPANLDVEAIRQAFLAASGNLTAAARLLGVHRATLYRYLKKHNLKLDDLRS